MRRSHLLIHRICEVRNIFLRLFIYLFLENGEGKEKEREISMCGCLLCAPCWGLGPLTQACALAGNQTGYLMVLRPMLNSLSYTSQSRSVYLFSPFWLKYFLKIGVYSQSELNLNLEVHREGTEFYLTQSCYIFFSFIPSPFGLTLHILSICVSLGAFRVR